MVPGEYCASTEAAVRHFQEQRGLRADGVCDDYTWTVLVEANWDLGDRLLYLTSPHLRGDDVSELQSTLCRLGFDCGRVDGILGTRTQRALIDFQTNCGLVNDGVCGPTTVKALRSLSSYTGDGPGIAAVRESERLRDGFDSMAHCRIVVGQFGGLTPLVRAVAHSLRDHGASVMSLDEPDALAQAKAANLYGAHVYVGFESSPEPVLSATFFQVPTFESVGGRVLADSIAAAIAERLTASEPPEVVGMRLPILRETRMPAVLLTVGAPRVSATAAPAVVDAVVNALEAWARPPADGG